ncbi:MAG: antibiotic biosynthesis monooxygenase, partial [Bacteroidota bacterium]
MIVTIVHVWVKPENIDDFIAATLRNHQGSIQESGNRRFDFLQSSEDPGKFTLYEVYETQADVDAHKTTEHYLTWRETVNDWMAKPRKGERQIVLGPTDPT